MIFVNIFLYSFWSFSTRVDKSPKTLVKIGRKIYTYTECKQYE